MLKSWEESKKLESKKSTISSPILLSLCVAWHALSLTQQDLRMAPVLRSATRSRATGRGTTTEPKSRALKKKTSTTAKPRARTQAKKKKKEQKKTAKVEPVEGDSELRIRSSVVSAVFSEGLMRNTILEHLPAQYRALAIFSMYING